MSVDARVRRCSQASASGGDGTLACTGDMLLEALVATSERYCVFLQTLTSSPGVPLQCTENSYGLPTGRI